MNKAIAISTLLFFALILPLVSAHTSVYIPAVNNTYNYQNTYINGSTLVGGGTASYIAYWTNATNLSPSRFTITAINTTAELATIFGTVRSVTAGYGLNATTITTTGTLNVNTSVIQQRVSSSCASGSSIRVINQDGTVTCETDSTGSGTVTQVNTGSGLYGGPITTTGTLSVNYSDVSANLGNVSAVLPAIVANISSVNATAQALNANKSGIGTATCAVGTVAQNVTLTTGAPTVQCVSLIGTSYTNGTGLLLNGNQFNVSKPYFDALYYPLGSNPSGYLTVETDPVWMADKTSYASIVFVQNYVSGVGNFSANFPSLYANISSVNVTKANPGNCPTGFVVQNTTITGVQCILDTTGTGTITSVALTSNNSAVTIWGSPITTSGTFDLLIQNATTLQDGLMTAAHVTSLNLKALSGNCPVNQFVQNATTGGVQCFTPTDTDTQYTNGTGLNLSGTTFSANLPFFDLRYDARFYPLSSNPAGYLVAADLTNYVTFTNLFNWGNGLQNLSLPQIAANIGNLSAIYPALYANISVINSTLMNRADALNLTKAGIGNCAAGEVVQNTTSSGVQCVTVSSGGDNASWNQTYANTLYAPINYTTAMQYGGGAVLYNATAKTYSAINLTASDANVRMFVCPASTRCLFRKYVVFNSNTTGTPSWQFFVNISGSFYRLNGASSGSTGPSSQSAITPTFILEPNEELHFVQSTVIPQISVYVDVLQFSNTSNLKTLRFTNFSSTVNAVYTTPLNYSTYFFGTDMGINTLNSIALSKNASSVTSNIWIYRTANGLSPSLFDRVASTNVPTTSISAVALTNLYANETLYVNATNVAGTMLLWVHAVEIPIN